MSQNTETTPILNGDNDMKTPKIMTILKRFAESQDQPDELAEPASKQLKQVEEKEFNLSENETK